MQQAIGKAALLRHCNFAKGKIKLVLQTTIQMSHMQTQTTLHWNFCHQLYRIGIPT